MATPVAAGSVSAGVARPEPELLPRRRLGKGRRGAETQPVGSLVEALPAHGTKSFTGTRPMRRVHPSNFSAKYKARGWNQGSSGDPDRISKFLKGGHRVHREGTLGPPMSRRGREGRMGKVSTRKILKFRTVPR